MSEGISRRQFGRLAVGGLAAIIAGCTSPLQRKYDEADMFYKNSDYRAAVQALDEAVALDPACALTYQYRGKAHSRMGNWGKAQLDFDRAIQIDPKLIQAYTNRGYVEFKRGEIRRMMGDEDMASDFFEKAVLDLEKAIALDAASLEAWVYLGDVQDKCIFDGKKALSAYEKAVELMQQKPELKERMPKHEQERIRERYKELDKIYGKTPDRA